MPIYDYQCKYCKYKKEIIQKNSEINSLYCNICKKKSLVRLISKISFKLKGNGWYETDFKSNKKHDK